MYELNNKGVVLSRKGKLEEAIKLFEAALIEAPNDGNILYNLALVYMKKNNFKKAIDYLLKSVEQQPGDDNLRELGVCYIRLKEFDIARKYLVRASMDYGSSNTENVLGVLFFQQGHYLEAKRYFSHATKLDPENRDAWFNLSDTYSELGETENAKDAREKFEKLGE